MNLSCQLILTISQSQTTTFFTRMIKITLLDHSEITRQIHGKINIKGCVQSPVR